MNTTTEIEEITQVIMQAKTAFLSTVNKDGFPDTRAMLPPRKIVGIKEFWFTTNTSSNKVEQILNNPKSCIYFFNKQFSYYGVTLIGTGEILTDKKTKSAIWKTGDEMYYSEGVTDPDYAVIKFTAAKVKYYHAFKKHEFEV